MFFHQIYSNFLVLCICVKGVFSAMCSLDNTIILFLKFNLFKSLQKDAEGLQPMADSTSSSAMDYTLSSKL